METAKDIKYKVRSMRKEDFPQVLALQEESGWHGSVPNTYLFYEIDPNGWKVAATDDGKIIGICCAIRHHDDSHFVGFYYVKSKFRGVGIGTKIWEACMEYIGDRNAGLNSVPEMLDKYQQRSRFSFRDEDCLLSFYLTFDEIRVENLATHPPEDIRIMPFDESHLPALFEYDDNLCGYNRQRLIELYCKEKDYKTLVALKDNKCVGWATIGYSILKVPFVGPMYADDADIAESMLKGLLLSCPLKKGFVMATFAANKAAPELMRKIGCPKVGEYPRLYRYVKKDLKIDFRRSVHKMFAQFDIYFSPF